MAWHRSSGASSVGVMHLKLTRMLGQQSKTGEEKKRGEGGNTVGLPYSDLDQNLEGTAFSNHDLFIINKKGVLINIFFSI